MTGNTSAPQFLLDHFKTLILQDVAKILTMSVNTDLISKVTHVSDS